MIPGTKSSLYVEEIFEFSDILYGTIFGKQCKGMVLRVQSNFHDWVFNK